MTTATPVRNRFIDTTLVTGYPDATALVGSQCRGCSTVTFPSQPSCPRCAGVDTAPIELATTGTLWSYTIQGFVPKTPYLGADQRFRPFGVGYVDLGGQVLVESRLVADDLATLRIAMAMQLVLEPFHTEDDGTTVHTFAFTPTESSSS